MGKKSKARSMQEAGAESFLAPKEGSVSAPKSEVYGIQINTKETQISIPEEELQNLNIREYEYCYYAPYGITKCAVEDCDRYPTFKIVNQDGITIYVCKPHATLCLR